MRGIDNSGFHLRVMTGAAAIVAGVAAVPAHAQVRSFDVQAQAAARGIPVFAKQAGVQIVASGKHIQTKRTNAVRGRYTVEEALRRLLADTGLAADGVNAATGIITIREASRGGPLHANVAEAEGEDIVVTARKREERLIEVPIALTAMRGSRLEKRGVRNLADVLQEAPGVAIVDGGNGNAQIAVRGISTTLGSNENGYYLDELPFTGINVPLVPDVRAWDLDRIEVLRGPQGTLFGEGSMGGTIRILTRNPALNGWEAKGVVTGSGTRGGKGDYGAKGAINIPILTDRVALRLAGTHEKIGGWTDDPFTDRRNVNDQRIDTFRAKLRIDPVDRLSLNASYWLYDGRFDSGNLAMDDGTLPLSVRPDNGMRYELVGATARYAFGGTELFYSFSHNRLDVDLSSPFLGGEIDTSSIIAVTAHELRMASTGAGPFKWTAGYYHRDASRTDLVLYPPLGIDSKDRATSRTNAVFGEATLTVAEAFDLTAGLRYFHDRLGGREENNGIVAPAGGKSYESFNPRFGLAWRPDRNVTVYATVAKGFRSGMTQSLMARVIGDALGIALPDNLSQDSLWSYELGAKADLLDGLVMLEGAVYRSRWKNVTVRRLLGDTGLNGLINSRGTRTTGVEFGASLRPAAGLTLAASGSWNNAAHVGEIPGTDIVRGTRVDDVPRLTLNGSVDYQRPVSAALTATGRIGVQHSSRRFSPSQTGSRAGDPITRIDARLAIEAATWSVALFGENLTNEKGAVSARSVTMPAPGVEEAYASRLRPLTIGIAISFNFDG